MTSGNINGEPYDPQPHLTPQTRPERLANSVLSSVESSPLYRDGDKIMVLVMAASVPAALRAGPGRRQAGTPAGCGFHGYTGPRQAINDLLIHLQGIGASAGMEIAPVWMDQP